MSLRTSSTSSAADRELADRRGSALDVEHTADVNAQRVDVQDTLRGT